MTPFQCAADRNEHVKRWAFLGDCLGGEIFETLHADENLRGALHFRTSFDDLDPSCFGKSQQERLQKYNQTIFFPI